MKRLLLSTLITLVLTSPLLADEPLITNEKLKQLAQDLAPLVERSTGIMFLKIPTIRIATRKELKEILLDELRPQMKLQAPQGTEEQLDLMTAKSAEFISRFALGKFAVKARSVLVIPQNFIDNSRALSQPRINTWEYVQVITLHELVHAMDEQAFRGPSRLGQQKTTAALEVWSAVIEGHAQFVTRRILASAGQTEISDYFEKMIYHTPTRMSEGEKLLAALQYAQIKFAYVDGRKFFDHLAANFGQKEYVKDVFNRPPASPRIIMRPAQYYNTLNESLTIHDMSTLWAKLSKDRTFEGATWNKRMVKLSPAQLRAALERFAPIKALARSMTDWRDTQVLIRQSDGGQVMVYFSVSQMKNAKSAEDFFQLVCETIKTKVKRLKTGPVRILSANIEKLKGYPSAKHQIVAQQISAGGQVVSVRLVLATVGRYTIEMLYQKKPAGKEAILRHLNMMTAYLKKLKN